MEDVSAHRITLPRMRAELVQRPALHARLVEGLTHCKLVLLSAPAGYGKTVALVRALASLPDEVAVAWLAIAEGDSLHSLLTGMVVALEPFDLPWRMSPDALPQVAQREHGLGEVAAEFARVLERCDAPHGVIAMDDVHRIADARVFEFLELLLRWLPSSWTLAMTSRVDPPLSLARLRIAQELAEFREAELRFDGDEVLALLRSQQPEATPHEAQQLLQSTQGWPAGLSVSLLASQRASTPRQQSVQVQRRMFEYLAQEVLEQLPPPFQDFLLRCAVLPEWTARRCAQVSGDAQAARWLDELERRELFVTAIDGGELTLRVHDLFRDFLQWQLARDHADELPELLTRAAQGEPDPAARVTYLLRAGATAQALREMLRVGASMIHAGADEQVLQLIERFPAAEREASPELAFLQGLCAWNRWKFDLMSRHMRRAMEGFERRQQWNLAVQARALAVVAMPVAGEVAEAQRLWQSAPKVEPNPTVEAACELVGFVLSWYHGPGPSTAAHLSRLVTIVRPLREALRWLCFFHLHVVIGRWGLRAPVQALVEALAAAADEAHPRMKLMPLLWSAWLAMWRGDVAAARLLRGQLVEEAKWLGDPSSVHLPLQHLMAIEKHLEGDEAAALEILRELAEGAASSPGRRSQAMYLNLAGAFAAASANWPAAQAALSAIERVRSPPPWPFLKVAATTLRAELALHRHAPLEARDLLQAQLQIATDGDHLGTNARLRVALARAQLRLKDAAAAWAVAEPLLREARVSGEVLGLLVCGPASLEELASARWPTGADPALLALLRDSAAEAVRLRAGGEEQAKPHPPGDGLSERELQVLELVAQGQSNKLIARELGLSPHTVKRHMARIFDKTGQSSRGQVAAWYVQARSTAAPSKAHGGSSVDR
jgi:LuxR family maltose regulon positive regulatory protein